MGIDSAPVAEYLGKTDFRGTIVNQSENPFGQDVLRGILPLAKPLPFGSFDIIRARGERCAEKPETPVS